MNLVIVGAGIAGLTAAYTAGLNGLETTVIEAKKEIGTHYKSSGAIALYWMTKISVLKDWNPVIEIPLNKAYIHTFKGKRIEIKAKKKPLGYVISQPGLEKLLAEEASKLGVNLITGTPVTNPSNIPAICGKEPDYIIDAGGITSPIARKYFALPLKEDIHKCLEYWINIPPKSELHIFLKDYCPKGYIWVIPSKNFIKVGTGIPFSEKATTPQKILEKFMIEHPEFSGEIIGVKGGIVPTTHPLHTVTPEPKIALIGDAARLVNPATGGGIQFAMLSGEKAIESLVKIGNFSLYEKWYRRTMYKQLRKWYKIKNVMHELLTKIEDILPEEVTVGKMLQPMTMLEIFARSLLNKATPDIVKLLMVILK